MAKALECVHSGLDLFESPGLQTSIQNGEYVEYRPLASLDDGPVEFSVRGSQHYLDLANSYLKVTAKVTLPNGGDLPAGRNVVPVNLTLHSLFSDVSVFLNGVQITTPSGAYPYQAYIQTLLSYSRDVKESRLEAAMFYADTAGHMEDVTGNDNAGMAKRKARASDSNVIDMMGRLHTDLFHQGKYLLSHLDLRVKLTRSKDDFLLMCDQVAGARPDYKVELIEAALFVRKVTVSPVIGLAHARTLEKANAVYPLTKTVMRVFSAAQGAFSFTADNVFLDKLPNRVVLALVRADAYNGSKSRNPFNFQHANVNFLCLYHQGTQIPPKGLRPNFAAGEVTQSYMTLFTGTNSAWSDESSGITMHDYANGYTLFCFDLTPSLEHSHAAFEVSRAGPLRVEMQFSNALAVPYNVVVYAELDGHVEITKTREVLVL